MTKITRRGILAGTSMALLSRRTYAADPIKIGMPLALTGPSKIFVSPVVFHILMPAIELPFTVRVPVVKSRLPPTALISPEVGPDDAAQVMELVMVTRLELRFSIFC